MKFFGDIRARCSDSARNFSVRYAQLRSKAQRLPSAYEIAAYFAVPLLLIAAGAMPSVALFLLPAILPLLYLLYRRLGAALPFSCVLFYALFSLLFNYDVLTVIYAALISFSLCGAIACSQCDKYLLSMAVAAAFAVIGAIVGMGAVRLSEGKPLGDTAREYVAAEYDDPFIGFLARDYYESTTLPHETVRVKPNENGYDEAVVEFFGEYAHDEFDVYAPYLCVHFGGLLGLISFFVSTAINRRTSGPCDGDATDTDVSRSALGMGGVRQRPPEIGSMKFPRAYLWSVLLPALVASIVLDVVGGFDALSATVMHGFVTLPSAAAFFTLGAYFASLFGGKKKIAAVAVLIVAGICAVVFSVALFVFSIIGLCDIILNLRFWTDFIRS